MTTPLTARNMLFEHCHEAVANIQRFENWVMANTWLDMATVDIVMPWIPLVCFEFRSKALVFAKLGAEGWKIGMSGETTKTVDGIVVKVINQLPLEN